MWWADLGSPAASAPGFRRPVVVVQGDSFNRSRIATVVCVPLTSNLHWAEAPGNVLLPARATRLSKSGRRAARGFGSLVAKSASR
jgi:mRNA interferase MazF